MVNGASQQAGSLAPVSPSLTARAFIPSANSSGKVASDAAGTPSARSPAMVSWRLKHDLGLTAQWTSRVIAGTPSPPSTAAPSHARAAAASRTSRTRLRTRLKR